MIIASLSCAFSPRASIAIPAPALHKSSILTNVVRDADIDVVSHRSVIHYLQYIRFLDLDQALTVGPSEIFARQIKPLLFLCTPWLLPCNRHVQRRGRRCTTTGQRNLVLFSSCEGDFSRHCVSLMVSISQSRRSTATCHP